MAVYCDVLEGELICPDCDVQIEYSVYNLCEFIYLLPVYDALHRELLECEVICADEVSRRLWSGGSDME